MTYDDVVEIVEGLMIQSDWECTNGGECWAYLKAGCNFSMRCDNGDFDIRKPLVLKSPFDFSRVEITVTHKTFSSFEYGMSEYDETESYIFQKVEPKPATPTAPTISREQLLMLCQRAVSVPESKWSNRDAPDATAQIGMLYALLLVNKPFAVRMEHPLTTNDRTWWIECGGMKFYVPTARRLDESAGRHWY